jgi:hypothetical protein
MILSLSTSRTQDYPAELKALFFDAGRRRSKSLGASADEPPEPRVAPGESS